MAEIIFGSILLSAGFFLGLKWARMEDTRREKEKPKMNIPKDIDDSLDYWERKIS